MQRLYDSVIISRPMAVLLYVAHNDDVTGPEIAAELSIDRVKIWRYLNELAKDGYITSTGQRPQHWTLTSAGQACLHSIGQSATQSLGRLIGVERR